MSNISYSARSSSSNVNGTPEYWDKIEELATELKKISDVDLILHYSVIEDMLKVLAGKILTIIDASIADKQQNKCIKDLIKAEFFRRINETQKMYGDASWGHPVDLEEAREGKMPMPLN